GGAEALHVDAVLHQHSGTAKPREAAEVLAYRLALEHHLVDAAEDGGTERAIGGLVQPPQQHAAVRDVADVLGDEHRPARAACRAAARRRSTRRAQPLAGPAQSLAEGRACAPSEVALGERRIEHVHRHVERAWFAVLDLDGPSEELLDLGDELVQARALARAD